MCAAIARKKWICRRGCRKPGTDQHGLRSKPGSASKIPGCFPVGVCPCGSVWVHVRGFRPPHRPFSSSTGEPHGSWFAVPRVFMQGGWVRHGSIIVVLLLLTFLAGCTGKAPYPSQPLVLICPWSAGGGTDRVARHMAAQIETKLGVPVNVVNATGGGGVTGHHARRPGASQRLYVHAGDRRTEHAPLARAHQYLPW